MIRQLEEAQLINNSTQIFNFYEALVGNDRPLLAGFLF